MTTKCFVDGSSRPEGCAAAVVIYSFGEEIFRTVKPLPMKTSSSVAEAEAILLAVNLCWFAGYSNPVIYTDSNSFCDQFKYATKVRSQELFYYLDSLHQIERQFGFILNPVKRKDVFVPDDICKTWLGQVQKDYLERVIQ